MNKKNILFVFLLGIIPEVLLAMYLEDIWYKDFLDSLIFLYAILFALWLGRFLLGEIAFRLFIQEKFINNLYIQLVENKFPNPWNYHMDDGLSYFQEVGRNINNENLSNDVCSMSSELYGQIKGLYDANQLSIYFRMKRCLKIAVKRFMDNNFPDSITDLRQQKNFILDLFIKNNFPDPSGYNFHNHLEYLNQIVLDPEVNNKAKIGALQIIQDYDRRRAEIIYSQMNYELDMSRETEILNNEANEYLEAINDYSQNF